MAATAKHQLIFGKLLFLGFLAVGMILGCVFWLTARIDQLERESAGDIVQLLVTERVNHVEGSTGDYAYWSFAYEIVSENNISSIEENIGSGATEGGLFDQIVLLDSKGNITHVFNADGEKTEPEAYDTQGIEPFLTSLRKTKPGDEVTISGIGQIDRMYGAIGAAWITPEYYENLNGTALPIIVGIKYFSDDALQAIANLTQGTGYAITPKTGTSGQSAVELEGPDGSTIAQLVWSPQNLGTVLRKEIMPGIVLVCFGIFAICVSAARYFHKQSKALDRAMTIASTDQLTGLLNRSGLTNVLAHSELSTNLDAGTAAVLYLDLNDFKKLNDKHGHKVGDYALKVTAERLKQAVRSEDYVIRLGGDEFIAIVLDKKPELAAKSISDCLMISFKEPMTYAELELVLTPSLGVAIATPGMTWDTLLGQADEAMYRAKRKKQKTAEVFAEDDHDHYFQSAMKAAIT